MLMIFIWSKERFKPNLKTSSHRGAIYVITNIACHLIGPWQVILIGKSISFTKALLKSTSRWIIYYKLLHNCIKFLLQNDVLRYRHVVIRYTLVLVNVHLLLFVYCLVLFLFVNCCLTVIYWLKDGDVCSVVTLYKHSKYLPFIDDARYINILNTYRALMTRWHRYVGDS